MTSVHRPKSRHHQPLEHEHKVADPPAEMTPAWLPYRRPFAGCMSADLSADGTLLAYSLTQQFITAKDGNPGSSRVKFFID
jgi:hypothetical protein